MRDPMKRAASIAAYRARHPERIKAYEASYHAAHPVEHRARCAAYYVAHRDADAERRRIYAATHREERAASDATYRAAHREEIRAVKAAYRLTHRDVIIAQFAAWVAGNPDKRREHTRKHNAKRRGAPMCEHAGCLTLGASALAWQVNPHVCWLCGTPVWPGVNLHMDHVAPISKGGLHCADNLRPACADCNMRKGARAA